MSPEHPEILDRFWAYLEDTPPDGVSPVISGYFAGVAAALLERYPKEATGYLQRRGGDALLERFLERLHSRSLAELMAFAACAESPTMVVFGPKLLVDRLVQLLEDSSVDQEAQEHVALVLGGMLAQGPSLCYAEELAKMLAEPSMVERLMKLILHAAEPARASVAASVLAGAVYHTSGVSGHPDSPVSSPSVANMAVANMAVVSPYDTPADEALNLGLGLNGAGLGSQVALEAPLLRTVSTRSQYSYTKPIDSNLELVSSVCSHLADVREFLEEAVDWAPRPKPGRMSSVLEVILLLTLLVKAQREAALHAFQKEQLLPVCIKALFLHPWSSLLHNAVATLFSEVLCAADSATEVLFMSFVSTGGLMETVVSEFRKHPRGGDDSGQPKVVSVGYMGQLHQLCCEVRSFAKLTPKCGAALAKLKGWVDVVLPALDVTCKMLAEELGGGVPFDAHELAPCYDWPEGDSPRVEEEVVEIRKVDLEDFGPGEEEEYEANIGMGLLPHTDAPSAEPEPSGQPTAQAAECAPQRLEADAPQAIGMPRAAEEALPATADVQPQSAALDVAVEPAGVPSGSGCSASGKARVDGRQSDSDPEQDARPPKACCSLQ